MTRYTVISNDANFPVFGATFPEGRETRHTIATARHESGLPLQLVETHALLVQDVRAPPAGRVLRVVRDRRARASRRADTGISATGYGQSEGEGRSEDEAGRGEETRQVEDEEESERESQARRDPSTRTLLRGMLDGGWECDADSGRGVRDEFECGRRGVRERETRTSRGGDREGAEWRDLRGRRESPTGADGQWGSFLFETSLGISLGSHNPPSVIHFSLNDDC